MRPISSTKRRQSPPVFEVYRRSDERVVLGYIRVATGAFLNRNHRTIGESRSVIFWSDIADIHAPMRYIRWSKQMRFSKTNKNKRINCINVFCPVRCWGTIPVPWILFFYERSTICACMSPVSSPTRGRNEASVCGIARPRSTDILKIKTEWP